MLIQYIVWMTAIYVVNGGVTSRLSEDCKTVEGKLATLVADVDTNKVNREISCKV